MGPNTMPPVPLEYRQLGKSDLCVSSIGLGCVTFGREIDAAASFQVLDRAWQRGINLLDTAAVYGDGASERVIGQWLRDRKARDRMVLATKVSGRLTPQNIVRSVEESLRRLGVDRIDLLQAHTWDDQTPLGETLEAFHHLVVQGKVRYCGSSNWQPDQLVRALAICEEHGWSRLESVQPIYNLVDRRIERELLPLCAKHRIGVLTYSPLGAGFLAGKYRRDAPIPPGTRFDVIPGHQKIYFTDHGFRVVESLRKLASQLNRPMVQLALAWVLRRRGVTSVLIGARAPDQVDQAFEAIVFAVR
jgi:1-deoxyxylulose-5-phosphate synthase